MIRLIRSSILLNNFKIHGSLTRTFKTSNVLGAGFAKDFKPGQCPHTEEERIAAAKKYGLRPEDYKPYPDDGMGFGDYPNLGPISSDMKSDWEDWDDPYNKRNFGEPVHINQEQLASDKVSLKKPNYSFTFMLTMFLAAGVSFFGLMLLSWDQKLTIPVAPKQYPRNVGLDGEKHYTF